MRLTSSQIRDIRDAQIWVMDPNIQFVADFRPLSSNAVYQIQGVAGVEWAVPLYKWITQAHMQTGSVQDVILLGFDDATLVGAPCDMIIGGIADLRHPDAVIVDEVGFQILWPNEPIAVGKVFELNERRAEVVGICRASKTFRTLPIVYTRYSQATAYVPPQRKLTSFVLANAKENVDPEEVCRRIEAQTGLMALTKEQFIRKTMMFYVNNTGIVANFAITVLLGTLIGCAVTAHTFYSFTLNNLPQFGTLKAMGVRNGRLLAMIFSQGLLAGAVGFGIGLGLATLFCELINRKSHLISYTPWQILVGTGIAVFSMMLAASLLSAQRVLRLEPALIFHD
jgi:putative ABC transport system permease protein